MVFSVSAYDIDTGVGPPGAQGNKEVTFDIVGGNSVRISRTVKHHILKSLICLSIKPYYTVSNRLLAKIRQPSRYT